MREGLMIMNKYRLAQPEKTESQTDQKLNTDPFSNADPGVGNGQPADAVEHPQPDPDTQSKAEEVQTAEQDESDEQVFIDKQAKAVVVHPFYGLQLLGDDVMKLATPEGRAKLFPGADEHQMDKSIAKFRQGLEPLLAMLEQEDLLYLEVPSATERLFLIEHQKPTLRLLLRHHFALNAGPSRCKAMQHGNH